ncbi:hypothetical protein [Gynuella sunshinyii]|uniref:Uncharacterized protein n=1 Tax=Gynuella sunshinyii YC6258 TaxID=1445510 RepID=A0A0C5VPQ7_9GAMM|nr:hypothetical protein [Gynuella sunshinyii]AJQ96211.1 hypothetical Protein YC6258_04175 [Gynuella sunshinyii YC6258]
MNIYFVTRWGNDEEGVNEADTNFIVLASNYEEAAKIVDDRLMKVKALKAACFCQRITEIGTAHSDTNNPKVLLGPCIEYAFSHDDIGIPNDKKWVRDSIDEGWEKFSEYYEE